MNKLPSFFPLLLLGAAAITAAPVRAQWITETYALKGGWNAIQLHGAASGTPDQIFSSGDGLKVTEIWRWNPNPTQVQYTTTPLIPSPGTPEWSVWKRGFPQDSNLTVMSGQTAYLVKCDGPASSTFSVPLKLSPLPPGTEWLRTGANLLGFPSAGLGNTAPLFSSYFATFPAAIAPSTKIFKYVGGEFGQLNPLQVLTPSTERLDRHTAYWFDSAVVSNFYAPLEISLSNPNGPDFGKTGSAMTVRVSNRSSAPVTLNLAPVASETAPAGEAAIAGTVPLTRRTFNAITAAWTEVALPGASSEVIAPQSTVELNFGLNRGLMSTTADTFYASLLRLTDSANLVDISLPVRARSSSLAGLWTGDALVNNVQNQAKFSATASANISQSGVVTGLNPKTFGLGYVGDDALVTIAPPPAGGIRATAQAKVIQGKVMEYTLTNGGKGYLQPPAVTISPPSAPPGGAGTARSALLRIIIHIDTTGRARLLSQVFLGTLASTGQVGLCTREIRLKQDAKASASRLLAVHLPMDRVIADSSGNPAVLGSSLQCLVSTSYDESTNPFVHRFHPDHDNKDDRGQPLNEGVESHTISRAMTFELTTTPPAGSPAAGWGSTVIGGNYHETLSGLSRDDMVVSGTFELRRVSELGELTEN